jgi:hypothetical protein
LATLVAEKPVHVVFQLQLRLIDVEVHTIDALEFQGHVFADDVGNGAW